MLRKDKARLARGRKKGIETELNREGAPATLAVLSYLDSLGIHAIENPDRHGPSIVSYSGLRPLCYIDITTVTIWNSGSYPLSHVRVGNYITPYLDLGLPITVYVLSKDLTRAILVPGHLLTPSTSGRDGYSVPVDELEQVQVEVSDVCTYGTDC